MGYCNSEIHMDYANELISYGTSFEVRNIKEECSSVEDSGYKSGTYHFQLKHDVQRLEQQLQEEIQLHAILENVLENNSITLSTTFCIPHHAQELVSNITLLDVTVSKLEKEVMSLQLQLTQERNERRISEYHMRHSFSEAKNSCSTCLKSTISEDKRDQTLELNLSFPIYSSTENAVELQELKKMCMHEDAIAKYNSNTGKLSKRLPPNRLWDQPNILSEEMVKCMRNIFLSLADSTSSSQSLVSERHSSSFSPRGHLYNFYLWSSSEHPGLSSGVRSLQVDLQGNSVVLAEGDIRDPYRVREKLSWVDIGLYGFANEVSWLSVKKNQVEYATGELRTFRLLVEQLAKVNAIHLSSNEKIAFWINLYNALIMHSYLAYGIPKSDLKLFSLMQKAAYSVGGHSFSAAAIEYVILKMKAPVHRPQIALLLALQKLKITEQHRKFAVGTCEPLVAFALSCGMYSSPAVRIYTAENVGDQLLEAQREFIRASVGVSNKGRLLVPKMLHCFAKNFVEDTKLSVWISRYLPSNQASFVEKCISQRRHTLLGSRNCGILPFDSRFRYLFLPDNISS